MYMYQFPASPVCQLGPSRTWSGPPENLKTIEFTIESLEKGAFSSDSCLQSYRAWKANSCHANAFLRTCSGRPCGVTITCILPEFMQITYLMDLEIKIKKNYVGFLIATLLRVYGHNSPIWICKLDVICINSESRHVFVSKLVKHTWTIWVFVI